ncbi:MAG: primosomal protein N' [Clostridia bacterium]|nr:primosomal protein N' [Clostridia bacterium]
MISNQLKNEIEENLKNKKQTILFLNRRGYSSFVICRDCGYTAKCKNCNITLTYHKFEDKLKCHYCGFEMKNLSFCPECNSKNIKYFGTGTQKLEDEVHKMFPECSTIRMDIDTVTTKNSHEAILNKFKNENIDILIGTQMVVKGHHFPKVTLVGVISADSSLNIEDYRATERTFQTIVQVAGRAGREQEKGRVIIQTYNPDSYAILDAKEQNYDKFYAQEIGLRKVLKYPPFCDIILVKFAGTDLNEMVGLSNIFYQNLQKYINGTNGMVFKPVPAPIDKIKNKFRWRIIIKGKVNQSMLKAISMSFKGTENAKKTVITVDINPNNT